MSNIARRFLRFLPIISWIVNQNLQSTWVTKPPLASGGLQIPRNITQTIRKIVFSGLLPLDRPQGETHIYFPADCKSHGTIPRNITTGTRDIDISGNQMEIELFLAQVGTLHTYLDMVAQSITFLGAVAHQAEL